MTLEGKVALVTGGSQGIGAAIAKKLASEGADIAILYVGNPAPAEETVAAIEAMGRKVACKVCDVSNFEETQAAIKEIISEFGGVDTFIEVGPGKTLAGLIGKINSDVRALNVEDAESLKHTIEEVKA